MADISKQINKGQKKWRQGVNIKSIPDVNDYIKFKILKYKYFKLINNDDLQEQYQEDFIDFTEATFKACDRIATYNLRTLLRYRGVWVNKQATIVQSLYDILCEKDQTEWTKEEVLNHINTNGFFASMKLNGIFIGPSIYINPPSPGEIGLLPYTTSHSQPTQQPSQQQYTLQQNGSTERSRGVVMLKEELDETLKEETIKTLDKDETQVDSGN